MVVYVVGGISGVYLNLVLMIGFVFEGSFFWKDVFVYIVGQMIGVIIGVVIVYFYYLFYWKVMDDLVVKLGVFLIGLSIFYIFGNMISEVIGIFVFVFGILVIGVNEFIKGLNLLIVGFFIVVIGIFFGGMIGYVINFVWDLGFRIVYVFLLILKKGLLNWRYVWIFVFGLIMGGVFGGVFYNVVFKGNVIFSFWFVSVIMVIVFFIFYIYIKKF